MNTLAIDVHKELQQQGADIEFANIHEDKYREELIKELIRTFGGNWSIIGEGECELPENIDYDELNIVFARAAETVMSKVCC